MNYNECVAIVIEHIIANRRNYYPTLLDENVLKNIVIHASPKITHDFNQVAITCGMALKDDGVVETFNKAMQNKHCQAKLYDVYFSLENLEDALCNIEESADYGEIINKDTAIKSVITHELVHAVSIGFANSSTFEDEVYTDYFAKEIFSTIWPKETYFTNYDYPFNSENAKKIQDRSRKLGVVELKDRNLYFMGKPE